MANPTCQVKSGLLRRAFERVVCPLLRGSARSSDSGVLVYRDLDPCSRLSSYEDVNDADRLGRDPTMRWIVGGKAIERGGASPSQMSRFETELLRTNDNFATLAALPGAWIDAARERKPIKAIVLDMDSSVSPTHGGQ